MLCAEVSAQDVRPPRIELGDAQVDSALAEIELETENALSANGSDSKPTDATHRTSWQSLHADTEAAIIRMLTDARERFSRDFVPALGIESGQIDPDLFTIASVDMRC